MTEESGDLLWIFPGQTQTVHKADCTHTTLSCLFSNITL